MDTPDPAAPAASRDPEPLDLLAVARERSLELPGAEWGTPFGPDWDVCKVRGKVFILQTCVTGTPMVTLKAVPEDGAALREAYPGEVSAGYHMNKRHWISLTPPDDDGAAPRLDAAFVRDLVTESYLLVLERNVPRTERPVDPETFGS